jgi:hypothetical protein
MMATIARSEAHRQAGRTGVISWMDELDAKRVLGMALLRELFER